MGGQVVDTQSAEEFMRETLEKVSRDELVAVSALLATAWTPWLLARVRGLGPAIANLL